MDRDNTGFATVLASDYYVTPGDLVRLNSFGNALASLYVNGAPNALILTSGAASTSCPRQSVSTVSPHEA